MPSPPPSPRPKSKTAKKTRRSPLYRRFLEQQRELEQQRHQLAANEIELKKLRRRVNEGHTAHEVEARKLRRIANDAIGRANTHRHSFLSIRRSFDSATDSVRVLQERLATQDRGAANYRRLSSERTHLIRVIDLLRRHGTPRINALAAREAENRGVTLPECPAISTTETVVSYTDGVISIADTLSRPPEVPTTIRVSGNSARPTTDQNPSLGSLSTFEDRISALERTAAAAPVYAEVLDYELSPGTSFFNISSEFAATLGEAAAFATTRISNLFEEIPVTPASALAVALLVLFISVLAADRHHG